MSTALLYVALVAAPAGTFWALGRLLEHLAVSRPARRAVLTPEGRPLERLVADLRRLDRAQRELDTSEQPGGAARLRAVALAYDDTLRECCCAVGLPEPARGLHPMRPVERLEVELALARMGVTW